MTMRAETTRRVRAWRVPVCLAASMLIAAGGCGDDDHRERTLAAAVTVTVPATANPWLAGMPDGTQSLFGDRAPETSPVHVLGIAIRPGTALRFSASGVVRHGPEDDPLVQTSGPDGGSRILSHDFGPENGIADVSGPVNALMGVFLAAEPPSVQPPPSALEFITASSRDYPVLAPQLQQVFFIGDGLTSAGQEQAVVVPMGATRLFLGPMDGSQYLNNEGFFTVQVSD